MSNDIKTKPDEPIPAETPDEELARLRGARAKRSEPEKLDLVKRAIEKEKLIAKYETESGWKLGTDFVVIDTGHVGDPLVVAKKPTVIQWDKWSQAESTPANRYDFVAPSIAHPTQSEYLTLRQTRVGIDLAVANAIMMMMGVGADVEAGKS